MKSNVSANTLDDYICRLLADDEIFALARLLPRRALSIGIAHKLSIDWRYFKNALSDGRNANTARRACRSRHKAANDDVAAFGQTRRIVIFQDELEMS